MSARPVPGARDDRVSLCLVVPHFDHAAAFERSLPRLLAAGHPIIVVDDGSAPTEREQLRLTVSRQGADGAPVTLACLHGNRGKGAAVLHGCTLARQQGHTHALQIDADGQHDIGDLPALLAIALRDPTAIVSGRPVFDADAPRARVHGRKLTTLLIAIETLGGGIEDGLCGFRIYPLAVVERVCTRFRIAPRMGFDTDMLVKARWLDVPVWFVSTRVRYPADGRSHFHYLRDNLALIRLHVTLLAGALRRAPAMLLRNRRAGSAHRQRSARGPDR